MCVGTGGDVVQVAVDGDGMKGDGVADRWWEFEGGSWGRHRCAEARRGGELTIGRSLSRAVSQSKQCESSDLNSWGAARH